MCVQPHMMVSPQGLMWADRDPRRSSHFCRLLCKMGFGSLKTAWYMAHRVRSPLIEKNMDKLGGIVEVDEGFIGG